jgi:hypothetical protein
MAWGTIQELPEVITNALKSKDEGGSGTKQVFMEYCKRETKNFH